MSSKTKLFSACILQNVNMATNGKVTKLIIIHKIIIIKLNELKRNSDIPRIEPRTLNHKNERSTAKPRQLSRNVALNSLRIRQYCGIVVLTVYLVVGGVEVIGLVVVEGVVVVVAVVVVVGGVVVVGVVVVVGIVVVVVGGVVVVDVVVVGVVAVPVVVVSFPLLQQVPSPSVLAPTHTQTVRVTFLSKLLALPCAIQNTSSWWNELLSRD